MGLIYEGGSSFTGTADGLVWLSHGKKVEAKTADYTVTKADNGKVFSTRGATGAIVFTLPTVTAELNGMCVYFFNAVGQNMTVSTTASEMITFNDVAANSIAFSTAAELIGAAIMAVCDGTSWLVFLMTHETQTPTITT